MSGPILLTLVLVFGIAVVEPRSAAIAAAAVPYLENALGAGENRQHLQGYVVDGWYAPALVGAARTAPKDWSLENIAGYLKTSANASASGPMAKAIMHSTSHLTMADLRAVAVYLKDQPGSGESEPASAIAANGPRGQAGRAIYDDQCSGCHTKDATGIARLFPALTGKASLQTSHPDTIIRMIVEGTRVAATRDAPTMPAFHRKLSDHEVAAVITHIRNAWGNASPAVSADSVKRRAARRAVAGRLD
jgi:mono/diheme cytochrome c family protein